MSKSRYDKRRSHNVSITKSLPSNKKIREPLKCKKNIPSGESRKNSLKKCKFVKNNMCLENNEKSFSKSPKKGLRSSLRLSLLFKKGTVSISGKNMLKSSNPDKELDSIEIDPLSNFAKCSKTTLSSSRQSNKFQPESLIMANENISKLKSQKNKKKLDKLSIVSVPLGQNKSPCKNKRQSFYRKSNFITNPCENYQNKVSLKDIDSEISTPRISELPKESSTLRNSMTLRSAKKHKTTPNNMLLSKVSKIKEIRKSVITPKNQQKENTKEIQNLSSKLEKVSKQKNKERNSVKNASKDEQTRNTNKNQSLKSEVSSQENKGRNRVFRHIEQTEMNINYKEPEAVELFTNIGSSRRSMTLQTRPSSEKSIRNKISLRTRHQSEKTSNNLLSHKVPHTTNRDEIKKYIKISKDPKKKNIKNVKPTNNITSLTNQKKEMFVHKYMKRNSTSKHTQKSKNNKCFNDEDPQTPKVIPSKSKKKSGKILNNNLILKNCVVKLNNVEVRYTKNSAVSSKNQRAKVKDRKSTRNRLIDKDPQTPKVIPSKSPENAASSSINNVTLLPRKKSESMLDNDLRLKKFSVTLTNTKERHTKKSAVSSKIQKAKKRARKRLPSSPLKIETPIEKRRKLSVTFKKQARPRSYSEIIPIDDLSLSPFTARKTKSDGYKLPGRNTLKRKRLVMSEIKKADEDYQDDIFESKTFDHFKDMFPDSSDSSELSHIKTPKLACLLTPGIHIKTPAYKDCYSPTDYAFNRKMAEEYIYRYRKKKRISQVETPKLPEKKKLEFNKMVEKACAVQEEVQKLTVDSSDEEDLYFTDDL